MHVLIYTVQVRTPMVVAQDLQWSTQGPGDKQMYYEIFHANKNTYVDVLHAPTVDVYACLGLSDEFCRELGKTHKLGNLNVGQSQKCIKDMRGGVHVRAQHTDLTGGDCQLLLSEKCDLVEPVEGTVTTFAVLRPMAVAATSVDSKISHARDATKCFLTFHKLYSLFAASQELRLTTTRFGDFSQQHQALVREFFDCLMDKVGSSLVRNMKGGLTYMSWPAHYMAEHISKDMAAWAKWTGGLPFGRTSSQVKEHLNKIAKRELKRHTNAHIDADNLKHSKFKQALVRLAAKTLLRAEVKTHNLRKKQPCKACIRRGIRLTSANMHCRTSSRKCNPVDRKAKLVQINGRVIDEIVTSSSELESDSDGNPWCKWSLLD